MDDQAGAENHGRRSDPYPSGAEGAGVTLVLELLNSKVDHPDYQAGHTAWGLQARRAVGAPRVKLLYGIYHMQIMEGDIIRTIRSAKDHIGLYHAAAIPDVTTRMGTKNCITSPFCGPSKRPGTRVT